MRKTMIYKFITQIEF